MKVSHKSRTALKAIAKDAKAILRDAKAHRKGEFSPKEIAAMERGLAELEELNATLSSATNKELGPCNE